MITPKTTQGQYPSLAPTLRLTRGLNAFSNDQNTAFMYWLKYQRKKQ